MLTRKVKDEIKTYVYVYIDPRNNKPFYIGRGQGDRVFDHLSDETDSVKVAVIKELDSLRLKPTIEILRHGLSQEESKLVESVCIDLLGLENLTNEVKGKYSRQYGRSSIEDLVRRYDAPPVTIDIERCIAININKTYRPGMSARQLYECTRGVWPLKEANINTAEYALAVYQEVILEVYKIEKWFSAGAVFSERVHLSSMRVEFVGNLAPIISQKYKGKSLPGLFSSGARFPVRYINCGPHANDSIVDEGSDEF